MAFLGVIIYDNYGRNPNYKNYATLPFYQKIKLKTKHWILCFSLELFPLYPKY